MQFVKTNKIYTTQVVKDIGPWFFISSIGNILWVSPHKQIHKLLKDFRYRKGREFFKVNLSKIKDCFKKVSELSNKGEKKITISGLKKGIKIWK